MSAAFFALMEADVIIHPRRGRGEDELPERAFFLVSPADARWGLDYFQGAGATLAKTNLAAQVLVDKGNRFCVVGPALGAAAAALVLEKLIVLGVRRVILVSCCGAIDPRFAIGDLLVAGKVVGGDGVSGHYGKQQPITLHPDLTLELSAFLDTAALAHLHGTLWSTDAPYRERASILFSLRERFGISGVDMECAGLAAVAEFRSIELAAVFVISDELWGPRWRPGFHLPLYRQRMKELIKTLASFGGC